MFLTRLFLTLSCSLIWLAKCNCEMHLYCCSSTPEPLMQTYNNVLKLENETKIESFLAFQIHEKTQICLTRDNLTVAVELLSHEIDFPISEKYSFALPDLLTKCGCQCDADSRCHFPDCEPPCFKKIVYGGKCENSFGQICCSTRIVPSTKNFRAFRLGHPRHVLTFKVRQFFSGSEHISETVFRVTGSRGAKLRSQNVDIFLRADLTFQSFDFEHELTRADWILNSSEFPEKYFAVDKTFVNDVFERNPSKLGWFRPVSETFDVASGVVLSKHFEVLTSQCDAETFDVAFHGMTSSSDLTSMLRPIEVASSNESFDVDVAKRVVRVRPSADLGNNYCFHLETSILSNLVGICSFKKWTFPGLFFFIFVFSIQLTVTVCYFPTYTTLTIWAQMIRLRILL